MKQTFLLLIGFLFLSSTLFAEGYQVNLLSTRQSGMGHVGTGIKLGAESMHFNPAGLVYLKSNVDISLGATAIISKAKYKWESYKRETIHPASTPFYLYTGFKIYNNFAAGISVTTPFGSSLKWPKDWEGSALIQDIKLQAFVIQPTFSWQITDGLSVGAGLQMAFGNVNLSRALMNANEFQTIGALVGASQLPEGQKDAIVALIQNNKVPPAYARLKGDAHLRVGFNVGVMYDLCDKVTLGLSYRSKVKMQVKEGDAELTYANAQIEGLLGQLGQLMPTLAIPKYDLATFHAELPLPSNTTLGVSYRPNDLWELALDLQYVGWHAYDSLNVYFNEAELGIKPIMAKKDYKNTMIYRVGASYKATDRLTARLGAYFDETPISSENYNPETPGMNKLGISAGLSFEPYKNLYIDAAFLYIHGFSREGSYSYNNIVTQQPEIFKGNYKTTAFAPSLGISYKF